MSNNELTLSFRHFSCWHMKLIMIHYHQQPLLDDDDEILYSFFYRDILSVSNDRRNYMKLLTEIFVEKY